MMQSPQELISSFEKTLDEQFAYILGTARKSAPGGDVEWQVLVSELGLEPMSTQERGALARKRRHGRGAFPDEVERALTALSQRAEQTLHALAGRSSAPDWEQQRAALLAGLPGLVSTRKGDYCAWLVEVPKTNAGLGGIFAQARSTAALSKEGDIDWKTHTTVSCQGCGAPQSTRLSFVCSFCDGNLFSSLPDETGGAVG